MTFQNGVAGDLPVAGIYDDASLAGNWLVSLDTLDRVAGSRAADFFVVAKLAEGVDAGRGRRRRSTRRWPPFPQAKVQSNAEFRQDQEGQIDQLLLIITVLLAFAIVIAVLGISITLALGVFERTREIGLMRAVGMNRRQTRRTVRWEAIIVSTFGAVVGIVVGTLIGVALSLGRARHGDRPLAFSPTIIVVILIGAVIAGLVAALYPSYKASNMNVLEAIATESIGGIRPRAAVAAATAAGRRGTWWPPGADPSACRRGRAGGARVEADLAARAPVQGAGLVARAAGLDRARRSAGSAARCGRTRRGRRTPGR